MRLYALDSVLGPILANVPCLPVQLRAPEAAAGFVLAQDAVAPSPSPTLMTALRAGFALASAETLGASPGAPVYLARRPPRVAAGEALPEGADAVLDPGALTGAGALIEVGEQVAPGAHVRFAGHDLAAGEVVARAGTRLSPEGALACRIAGIEAVALRIPRVRVAIEEAGLSAWLTARLRGLGCGIAGAGEDVDLCLVPARNAEARLAIAPGETGWIALREGVPEIAIPERFDGALGVYVQLVLPLIARMGGAAPGLERAPLTAKIVSAIGASDLALLARAEHGFVPLGAGDLTLRAIARATHVLVLAPGSEGLDAGTRVAAISLADPFAQTPTGNS